MGDESVSFDGWQPEPHEQRQPGDAAFAPLPGEKVRIIAGRYRSGVGELLAITDVPTPSGSTVKIAVAKRPRAGETIVFSHEIERAE